MKAERGSHFLILEKSVSVTRRITCHILAMVQFKQSFIYNGAHPKTSSWKPEGENSSCCSSEGVKCDEETGHIIGLHLSSTCLYGSINSSNRLFHLVHLQKLDLSDNYFNYSQIPIAIRNFTRLGYLDLSASAFFGRVPLKVSQLSELSSLSLSFNTSDPFSARQSLPISHT